MPEQRPQAERATSVHPALAPENTRIPVTPAHDAAEMAAYFESQQQSSGPSPGEDSAPSSSPSRPYWNANTSKRSTDSRPGHSTSPSEAAAGARTGEELLRRLSLTGQRPQQPDLADVDPRAAHPSLNLSGQVISATFCVPYDIAHTPSCEWVNRILDFYSRYQGALTHNRNWLLDVVHLPCSTHFPIWPLRSLPGTTP